MFKKIKKNGLELELSKLSQIDGKVYHWIMNDVYENSSCAARSLGVSAALLNKIKMTGKMSVRMAIRISYDTKLVTPSKLLPNLGRFFKE